MNMTAKLHHLILMADDDAEDCLLVRDAVQEAGLRHQIRFVSNGEELLEYLTRDAGYESPQSSPRPDLVLLDLAMPRRGGREALRDIKSNPRLQRIPVVVLTTSTAPDDIDYSYFMGANSYVTKPVTFRGWIELLTTISNYWFKIVELPPTE
jgi:CheY-like chemotaxis protein